METKCKKLSHRDFTESQWCGYALTDINNKVIKAGQKFRLFKDKKIYEEGIVVEKLFNGETGKFKRLVLDKTLINLTPFTAGLYKKEISEFQIEIL